MTQLLRDILQGDSLLRGVNAVLLWDKVVERKIQKHTRALKLQRGILHVLVENSVWAQELNFYKEMIMRKMNDKAGRNEVRDIRFKVGGVNE